MAEDETLWMTRLLETSLQEAGLSEREVERRLGWRRGALGRILQGEAALTHEQILEVLDVLNRGSGHRPRTPGSSMVDDLVDRFRGLGYDAGTAALSLEPPATRIEMETHVDSILREAFGLEPEEEAEDKDA
ncbi:MAG TPA: helix-turn-helix transcriptional regulator [Thermoanaerobaculia bacterium]|nr:helix-turn-helix transcriptional regulator [Thermoanaerobaculia bacterium]